MRKFGWECFFKSLDKEEAALFYFGVVMEENFDYKFFHITD